MSMESPKTINVAITGAAGNIGYALLPKVVDGLFLPEQYGEHYTVNLRLLEIPGAMERLEGTVMELEDMALPHLGEVVMTDDPRKAFAGVNLAFLLGGIPRKSDMTRADLLRVNAPLFAEQGQALNDGAAEDIRIVVVSNPANSIALTTLSHAPDIPADRFNAMSRLDHNRAVSQLALQLTVNPRDIEHLVIWGNHSDTMVVDIDHVISGGVPMCEWGHELDTEKLMDTVATRGSAVIAKRGASSALSAATAAADTARDWLNGSDGRWHSMGLLSKGEYGVPEGIVSSFPVTTERGEVAVVEGLDISKSKRTQLDRTVGELLEEREALVACGAISAAA